MHNDAIHLGAKEVFFIKFVDHHVMFTVSVPSGLTNSNADCSDSISFLNLATKI